MIHRAPFGSLERFIAILIEHTGGNFPLWLTANQVSIIPVGEKHKIYSKKVLKLLENDEIRATVDDRNETVGKKIRESELKKVPFMLIVGDEEVKQKIFPVRAHGGKDIGKMNIDEFIQFIKKKTTENIKDF
jgi:threonyl-tRNA synthetase